MNRQADMRRRQFRALGPAMAGCLDRLKFRREHRYGWSVRKLCAYSNSSLETIIPFCAMKAVNVFNLRIRSS